MPCSTACRLQLGDQSELSALSYNKNSHSAPGIKRSTLHLPAQTNVKSEALCPRLRKLLIPACKCQIETLSVALFSRRYSF